MVEGWVDGRMVEKAGKGFPREMMSCWSEMSKNKTKMVRSLKIKFLIISKLNLNEGQIYKKISNYDYFKNWKIFNFWKNQNLIFFL